MATVDDVENKSETNISSEALDLLGCFVGGLDEIVFAIAAARARERHGNKGDSPVQVEVEDIAKAGEEVIQVIRGAIRDKALPATLASAIEQAERCFTLNKPH
jgi:hypothetical protein